MTSKIDEVMETKIRDVSDRDSTTVSVIQESNFMIRRAAIIVNQWHLVLKLRKTLWKFEILDSHLIQSLRFPVSSIAIGL